MSIVMREGRLETKTTAVLKSREKKSREGSFRLTTPGAYGEAGDETSGGVTIFGCTCQETFGGGGALFLGGVLKGFSAKGEKLASDGVWGMLDARGGVRN